jgi:hypothetical protein
MQQRQPNNTTLLEYELRQQLSRTLDCDRSPEDAVNGFMQCWHTGDWESALRYCSLSWIRGVFNPGSKFDQTALTILKSKFRSRTLTSWEVTGSELAIKHPSEPPLDPDFIIEINVRVNYEYAVEMKTAVESKKKRKKSQRFTYHDRTAIIKVRCIRERGIRQLDRNGEWSVNPESMSRQTLIE